MNNKTKSIAVFIVAIIVISIFFLDPFKDDEEIQGEPENTNGQVIDSTDVSTGEGMEEENILIENICYSKIQNGVKSVVIFSDDLTGSWPMYTVLVDRDGVWQTERYTYSISDDGSTFSTDPGNGDIKSDFYLAPDGSYFILDDDRYDLDDINNYSN